jgi:predicted transcriptional regulator
MYRINNLNNWACMKPESRLLLFLFMGGLLVLTVPASALAGGYAIDPAYGLTGTPAMDLTRISFWDLSLREMAIVAGLAVSPLCIIPLELLFAIKLFSFLGFRRIFRSNILNNATRSRVYSAISSQPGIRFPELCAVTGISRGALNYHIALLRISGKIHITKLRGIIRFFENNGKYSETEQKVLNCLNNGASGVIIGTLLNHPGSSRTDLEKILAVSGPTVSWHVRRLCEDGLIEVHKDGRFSRYELAGSVVDFMTRNPQGSASVFSRCGNNGRAVPGTFLSPDSG